jgi:hypothetical protein
LARRSPGRTATNAKTPGRARTSGVASWRWSSRQAAPETDNGDRARSVPQARRVASCRFRRFERADSLPAGTRGGFRTRSRLDETEARAVAQTQADRVRSRDLDGARPPRAGPHGERAGACRRGFRRSAQEARAPDHVETGVARERAHRGVGERGALPVPIIRSATPRATPLIAHALFRTCLRPPRHQATR